jgi:fucose 4-O-acetylase-like acetyltransferase
MANLEEVGIVSLTDKWKNKENSAMSRRKFKFLGFLDKYKENPLVSMVSWIGQRSMLFYITHFIVLYCLFKLVEMKRANSIVLE